MEIQFHTTSNTLSAHIPEELIRSLAKQNHFDEQAFLKAHMFAEPPVSIHLNPGKRIFDGKSWAACVGEIPFDISDKVPWAPDAYYLSTRPSFTNDPFFHAGNYYVQEASGMFLAHAIKKAADLTKKLKVLDLCAAPGGKSTMLQSMLSPGSLLVSNEVIKTRVPVLCQNMTKWGNINGMVTNNDPAHFKILPGYFDMMLIDAPCSGSGLYRKDPAAAASWTPDLVKLCSSRQQRILMDVWNSLKEDGFLIYSTCSYSKEENEDILDILFQQFACESIPLHPDPEWQIVETRSDSAGAFGYRFYPDKLSGEGFFISVIQKKEVPDAPRNYKSNKKAVRSNKTVEKLSSAWVQEGSFHFVTVGEYEHLLLPELFEEFDLLKDKLYLKKAGIRIGKSGENEWIPDQELALANILKDNCARLHLSKADAILFLKGEPFPFEANDRGWRLVSYQGQGMGWVKLLGNRMNNYYPKSWRIRH